MTQEQTKQTILIVEDDLPVLNALADKLAREGFGILQAQDGEAGLALADKDHPDLILLDILLPKMDGLTMMKKLRAGSVWGKGVPIILLTNLSPDDEKINASVAESEPAYYIVKTDLSMSDLVEKIRERLNRA